MDSTATLTTIEQEYRRVLDLTRDQQQHLAQGKVSALPELLREKNSALGRAQSLTVDLQRAEADLKSQGCQDLLARIAELLRAIMAAEEQCQALVPAPTRRQDRAAAVAAYGKVGGRR